MGHYLVVIAHGKFCLTVVLCEQYVKQLTSACFTDFIREYFHEGFVKSTDPFRKLFLQNGYRRQNTMAAKKALVT